MKTIVIPSTNKRAVAFLDKVKADKTAAIDKAKERLMKNIASMKVSPVKSHG